VGEFGQGFRLYFGGESGRMSCNMNPITGQNTIETRIKYKKCGTEVFYNYKWSINSM